MATIDDNGLDDDCILIGNLAGFISFEINAATPYVGGGEFMDWAINNIAAPGEPASLEVSIKLAGRDCVPLVVCLMQKKCSGL